MNEETFLGDNNSYIKRLVAQQIRSPDSVVIKRKNNENRNENSNNVECMDIDEDICPDVVKHLHRNNDDHSNDSSTKRRKGAGDLFGNSIFGKSPIRREHLTPVKNQPADTISYYGADRYIPKRDYDNVCVKFSMITDDPIYEIQTKKKDNNLNGNDGGNKDVFGYSNLLQNELLGSNVENIPTLKSPIDDKKSLPAPQTSTSGTTGTSSNNNNNNNNNDNNAGNSTSSNHHHSHNTNNGTSSSSNNNKNPKTMTDTLKVTRNLFSYQRKFEPKVSIDASTPYSLSPIGVKSQTLLRSPRKAARKICRIPYKVLDAPELQDDFYLNLVDWSSQNILAVGLGNSVYLWSACTSQVTRLCDFTSDSNTVTSVAWNEKGNYVAVGTHHGYVQIWDVITSKLLTKLTGHSARVGALAWSGQTLCSGSRDRLIFQRDVRTGYNTPDRRLVGHRQEVCGLKWSPDNQYLASGGNDNRLYVWNSSSLSPVQTYAEHLAAVKAIAWSPHQHGLLASGGGTADRCIRFWNTLTGQAMQCVDTGSQVCNLAWSKHSSELVSTHGYSQNQILVWKYPSLSQVAKLTGHSYRVLYLAMSPDGESIVTGAGDETLRFWNIFSKVRSQKEFKGSLNLFSHMR